jgi:CP family cyanate transporter-like MFS transporter
MLAGAKTNSPEATRNMSTMMQSIGYVLSACGPALLGWFFESFGNWNTALLGIVGLTFIQLIMGWIVGRPALIRA